MMGNGKIIAALRREIAELRAALDASKQYGAEMWRENCVLRDVVCPQGRPVVNGETEVAMSPVTPKIDQANQGDV
jgi:hypothetical protein